jgi:hypothetical protein
MDKNGKEFKYLADWIAQLEGRIAGYPARIVEVEKGLAEIRLCPLAWNFDDMAIARLKDSGTMMV